MGSHGDSDDRAWRGDEHVERAGAAANTPAAKHPDGEDHGRAERRRTPTDGAPADTPTVS